MRTPQFRVSTFVLVALLALSKTTTWASVFGDVRGVVLDPQERPLKGAKITLRAAASGWGTSAPANDSGEFSFRMVPLGGYVLSVEAAGFTRVERAVTVVSDSAPLLRIRLAIAPLSQSVDVVATAGVIGSDSPTPTTLVSRETIARTPGADRTNSLAMITNYAPGAYMVHDQLHIRGGHQVTWLVDGVPVPNTNIASAVGPQFDPKDIDYLEVQRGAYSAEFGDRTYGVFNVVPRTGFEYEREGEVVASYGNFRQTNDQLRIGSHGDRFAYYLSLNENRSDFGLATPTADVLHDHGAGLGAFSSLVYSASSKDQLRLVAAARGDRYEVPNSPESQEAGIRDVEQERDAFVNVSWVRATARSLLTVSPFYHFNRAAYLGGPADTPIVPTSKHDSHYGGGQVVFSALTAKHKAKAGFYGFFQSDRSFVGLRATDGRDLSLEQQQTLNGNLEALFVEDQYKPSSWLTLTAGLRFTRFRGSITEDELSPRLGLSLRLPGVGWVARGFYGRYYQAPPLSTVSGPVLDLALDEGFGFLPLHGEKDEEYQAGLTIPIRAWTIDADYFRNAVRNFFDHDALGESNVFFPLTIDRARIRGFEVTVKSPRLGGHAQLALAYARQRVEGQGAVTGGLTDFAPPDEGFFFLDHDQRHTLNAGFDVDLPGHIVIAGAFHYGSGFTDGEGPGHLPGHATFDLSLGMSFGKSLSLSVHALNAGNRRFLLDNSETFGGTHYVDPRQVYAQVRYRFHY